MPGMVSLLLSLIPQVLLNLLGTIEIGACIISSPFTSFWLIHTRALKTSRNQIWEEMRKYGTCSLYSCRKEMNSLCQVWCRANRDVGLDDTGVYPRDTICDARLPVLDTGTIQ